MGLAAKAVERPSRPQRAKVFWSGRSQALRLPKEFRLATNEVSIHREGRRLVIEPLDLPRDAQGWPTAFWELAGAAPEFDVGDRSTPHERGRGPGPATRGRGPPPMKSCWIPEPGHRLGCGRRNGESRVVGRWAEAP